MKNANMVRKVSFKRIIQGGLIAGVASAVLAIVTAQILQAASGLKFSELSPVPIALASLVSNLLGALVYFFIARRAKRPQLVFSIAVLVVTTLDSANIAIHPMHPGFGLIANPLHYVVALMSAILLPRFGRQIEKQVKEEFVSHNA